MTLDELIQKLHDLRDQKISKTAVLTIIKEDGELDQVEDFFRRGVYTVHLSTSARRKIYDPR